MNRWAPELKPQEEGRSRRRRVDFDVAVAGGGIAGAAAALAAARRGLRVALLEAQPPRPWPPTAPTGEFDLRVVGLAPSSIHLLRDLAVWPLGDAARVGAYRQMHVWEAAGGAAIHFDAAAQGQAALGYIVENRFLQWRLWQALEAAEVTRLTPCQVSGFTQDAERVRLQLAGSEQDALSSRLLVAADGGPSPLREAAGIGVWGRQYQQRAIVAHVSTERSHEETAWQVFLPSGPLALLPLADGRSSVVWSLPAVEAERVLALDDEAFVQALGLASDFRLGRILASTPRASFPLQLQLARRYVAGRLLLLGDAAHVVHPLAGQGVNLGLRDVAELAGHWMAGEDPGATAALKRYERRRRSADTLDALSFDALQRIYAARSPWMAALRGVGIRLCDHLEPLKRRLMEHAGTGGWPG